jgi:hypothetical protein
MRGVEFHVLDSRTEPGPDVPDEAGALPPRDPRFCPFRVPRGENAKAVLAEVLKQLDEYERQRGLRRRRRRAEDQATYERLVGAIVCDLLYRYLMGERATIAVSLSNAVLGRRSRYRGLASSTTLPDVLARMAAVETGFVRVTKGRKGNAFAAGRMTTIEPGEKLLGCIERFAVTLADLGEDLDQETIILKGKKADRLDQGSWLEYPETETTRLLRAQMRAINAWIAEADIECDPFVGEAGRYVNDRDRFLRRVFNNGSFADGGRLFGGFWQPLKAPARHEGIKIGGKAVATLDFGQMVVRILYGMAGSVPPPEDAYEIPGFPRCRDGIKKVFAALTFVDGDLKSRPRGTAKLLPRAGTIQDVTRAIRRYHAPIAPLLDRVIGHKVFAMESRILVDVLLGLKDQGIVALPIHDAVVVAHSAIETAKSTMEAVSQRHLGFVAPVSVTER